VKPLRLALADVAYDSVANLLSWIGDAYAVEFDEANPDFIIHSCFGSDALRYDSVRVAWLGENLQPDFNISDYAMGFGRIAFADRYRRIPLYRWYFSDYESLFLSDRSLRPVNGREELARKTRFCTAVVSNGSRGEYFANLFERLSEYKCIDSGGRWNNTIGAPIVDKLAFLGQGKFHVAFENSSSPGYITEKIMHAFVARTIPIYWGASDVARDFNPKAFVNCHAYGSVEEVVARVRELDSDDSAYAGVLEEPCFTGGVEPGWLSKVEIMQWLCHVLDQPREDAYRRNRWYWGERYESDLSTALHRPHIQAAKLVARAVRRRFRRR
jgi:hypothetical protein